MKSISQKCDNEKESKLRNILENILFRFPKVFDNYLIRGLDCLSIHFTKNFISERSVPHLIKLLIIQFFLQKRVEATLEEKILTKFFYIDSRLCVVAFLFLPDESPIISQDVIIKNIQSIIPGMDGIPGSFCRWLHPELPHMGLYIEMQKLRGKEISTKELRLWQDAFEQRLVPILTGQTASVFWPFNEEDAYKQMQVLQKELFHSSDLPQVVIHFRQLDRDNLEFMINLVRPPKEHSITFLAATLPPSVQFFLHFWQQIDSQFPCEACCFSLSLPKRYFNEHNIINLLQARACVVQYLQNMLGPFRDYNGGLFETQKQTFEYIANHLAGKIPHFSLFANKVFHALHPVEARFSLELDEWEKIFASISAAINSPDLESLTSEEENVWVFKTKNLIEIQPLVQQARQKQLVYVEFEHAPFYYFCVRDKTKMDMHSFQKKIIVPLTKRRHLKLAFLEGHPPSLSPYLTGGDVRCRALSKWLFEGLTRLDHSKTPQLAAAEAMDVSEDMKRYTFFLRPLNWSNGQRVTAFDFLNGWKNILSKKWFSNRPDLLFAIRNGNRFYNKLCTEQELGLYAPDASTLQIDLEYADPCFLEKLAQPLFFPTFGNSQEPHIFNGPYRIADYDKHRLELEINPYYWDVHSLFFQSIHIILDFTLDQIHSAFDKGEIDWFGEPFTPLPKPLLLQFEQEGKLFKRDALRPYFLFLNTEHPLLRSPLIRQAMSLSIDRKFICTHIFPFQPPLFSPIPMVDRHMSDENLQQARALFTQGLKSLALTENHLPKVNLYYVQLPQRKELATYLKNTWQKTLNLSVEIQPKSWNSLRCCLEKRDFHIAGMYESAIYTHPTNWLKRLEGKENFLNFSGWDHSDYRSIVSALLYANEAEEPQLIKQAVAILAHQCPIIPICSSPITYVKHNLLDGEVLDSSGCVDFKLSFLKE